MPRRLRIHAPGCFYHATLRGNHRQAIFRERADRALLAAIVGRSLEKSGARLHAYCWMTNHLHFLVQVGDSPLGPLMRDIASNYARAFQLKLETTGHLFERRYYAKLVHVETYLFAVVRYIHRNPLEDGLVARLGDYPWSSHRAYAGLEPPAPWLETNFVLSRFAKARAGAHDAYARFVQEVPPVAESAAISATEGDVLGDDDFAYRVGAPRYAPSPAAPTLDQLIDVACRTWEVSPERLTSASRDDPVVRARAWIAHEALSRGVSSLSEIARRLGRDRATLRYAIRRYAGTETAPGRPRK